jgi:hypothetical protein
MLGLPGGVAGDQDDAADGLAKDPSDVVLEEAVVIASRKWLVRLSNCPCADDPAVLVWLASRLFNNRDKC